MFVMSTAWDRNLKTEILLVPALTTREHKTSVKMSLSSAILDSRDLATHKKQMTLSRRCIWNEHRTSEAGVLELYGRSSQSESSKWILNFCFFNMECFSQNSSKTSPKWLGSSCIIGKYKTLKYAVVFCNFHGDFHHFGRRKKHFTALLCSFQNRRYFLIKINVIDTEEWFPRN